MKQKEGGRTVAIVVAHPDDSNGYRWRFGLISGNGNCMGPRLGFWFGPMALPFAGRIPRAMS